MILEKISNHLYYSRVVILLFVLVRIFVNSNIGIWKGYFQFTIHSFQIQDYNGFVAMMIFYGDFVYSEG